MRKFLILMLVFYSGLNIYAFDLYGHRGARGLAPENTLPSYKTALDHHVDFVDLDIAMTRDQVLIVQHDLTINPDITQDKHGNWVQNKSAIKNLSLQEIRQYDVGHINKNTVYGKIFPHQRAYPGTSIPTLQEVIEYVKKRNPYTGFQIEIKTDPTLPELSPSPELIAKALVNLIQKENIGRRTQIQAYDWRCLLAIQKIDRTLATAYLTDTVQEKLMQDPNPKIAGQWTAGKLLKDYQNSIPKMIKALGGRYWDPEDLEVTPENLKEAHELGLKVVAWSWAEKSGEINLNRIKKLIAMGIDGIITDRPDLVKTCKFSVLP